MSQLLLAPSHLYHVSSAESVKGSSNDRSETTHFVNKPQQQGLASFGPAHASVFPQQGSSSSLGQHYIAMSQERPAHTLQRGASAGSSQGFKCPNCAKVFARGEWRGRLRAAAVRLNLVYTAARGPPSTAYLTRGASAVTAIIGPTKELPRMCEEQGEV